MRSNALPEQRSHATGKAWIEREEVDVGIPSFRGFTSLKADVLNEWSEGITAAR